MSEKINYKNAIEALGMKGNRSVIHNKLNKVMAHTDDQMLSKLIATLLKNLQKTSTHTSHTSIKDMSACRNVSNEILQYCQNQLNKVC